MLAKILIPLVALVPAFLPPAFSAIPGGTVIPWQNTGDEGDILPVVEVIVNGKKLRGFIDTGARSIVVSPQVAERVGVRLDPKSAREGTFAGNRKSTTYTGVIESLQVGDAVLKNLPVTVAPGAEQHRWRDVTVGIEVLKKRHFLMDYAARRMVVLKKPFLPGQKGAVRLPFHLLKGTHLMIIEARLNGRPAHLHFDTGGTFGLNLASGVASSLDLRPSAEKPEGKGGAGQTVAATVYRKPVSVCVAQGLCKETDAISLEDTDAMWNEVFVQLGPPRIAGTLSHGFLSGLLVEYDFAHQSVWLMNAE